LDVIVAHYNELFRLCHPNVSMYSLSNNFVLALGFILSLSTCSTASTHPKPELASASDINRAFPYSSLEQWQEKSFSGTTRYELHDDDGITVLKATAINTASVLYREHTIDLSSTPWLEWSWKIESIYNDIDESTKAGDDFPARLYVTAKTGALPWQTLAINYVWSSNQAIDSVWANPYTSKSKMVSVQGGDSMVGQWVNQRRNIVEDFKQFFGIDVKRLSGYAVMVDGDNASQSGTAYFGNIEFVTN